MSPIQAEQTQSGYQSFSEQGNERLAYGNQIGPEGD
jgi:hypothetical protein